VNARDRLAALCARLNCDSLEDLRAERPTITLARRDGTTIGTVTRDTFDEAVAAHEEILASHEEPAIRGGPMRDVVPHPALSHVAERTRAADRVAAENLFAWVEAARQDPEGRVVRLRVEIGPDLTGEP